MKQKDLFTKRWRKVSVPEPLEQSTVMAVVSLMKRAGPRDAIWWHTPNEGEDRRSPKLVNKLIAMGMIPGFPDFCVLRQRQLYAIEFKRRGQPLSENQEATLLKLAECGAITAWFDNLDDTIVWLKKNNLLPRLTLNTE